MNQRLYLKTNFCKIYKIYVFLNIFRSSATFKITNLATSKMKMLSSMESFLTLPMCAHFRKTTHFSEGGALTSEHTDLIRSVGFRMSVRYAFILYVL